MTKKWRHTHSKTRRKSGDKRTQKVTKKPPENRKKTRAKIGDGKDRRKR
jgi:hypothetical protein